MSADIKEHMIKSFNLEASKVILIPNGIDIDTFAPGLPAANVAHELRGGSDKTLIVYASRLDAPLAPVAVNLIEACGRLYGEYPGLRLVVAGDGKHAVEVAARARVVNANAGAELVRLLGARTDMNRIMASADLIVGVSRVALEAMASGKNVILAGGEGYGGLVSEGSLPLFTNDNFTGRQFSKEASVQNIEDSIREFLYLPTESRKYMELLLRQFIVENYSSMRMARETAKVYEGVCSL